MANNEVLIPIPGRLHSVATEGHVAGTDEIYDDTLGMLQSEVNAAKADLVNGKVPSEQLPSYVDDVVNGYYYNGNFYKEAAHTTVITGEEEKIYVDIPTDKSYRWSGSAYILISNPYSVDEEDLTVVNNNIKFKDRPNTDGMGKVILRKNMVSGLNTLTQSMMQATNTIYVIRYDFTLGEDITVPANCILHFDGGSIQGAYTFTGNLTSFTGIVSLGSSITFAGTYNNIPTVYVDWFVRQYNVNVDCSNGIWKAITLAKLARTSLSFGGDVSGQSSKYYCTSGNFDVSGLVVHGNGSYINGIGNFNVFIVNGDCCIDNLCISKFPYQDGTSESPYQNFAIICQGNHRMKFDNVYIDGFYYGFYLDAAWNVIIDGCHTHRCSFGVYSSGMSVNNNIVNSRIGGTVSGVEITSSGGTEGFMIANNLIVGGKGIRLNNCANSIIKGNIIDLCTVYGIEVVLNCPGTLIEGNYIAINDGAISAITMYAQNIMNNEDQMIYIKNNIIKAYGSTTSYLLFISEGKYKHINISGNHLKSPGGRYELVIDGNINQIDVLYIRDNVIEGDTDHAQISVPNDKITNKFVTDNVVLNLMPS